MKVKELLDLLSTKSSSDNLYYSFNVNYNRVVTNIKLTISEVTLVRSPELNKHLKVRDIIKRLRSQDHKDLYFESITDLAEKIKIESIKNFNT